MKLLVVAALVAIASAAPPQNPNEAQIVDYNFDNVGFDGFNWGFKQSDGTSQQQSGKLINQGTEDEYLSVQGSYEWYGPDGVLYVVKYTADQNGYQPEIEQGPGGGVPPGIVASLLG